MEQAKAGFSRLFEKSLSDLVRGIRNNKKNEGKYISQCIQEIKEELKSGLMEKKTVAIQKLTYLQMLGYDMSWASFNVIEVMSQNRFTSKRIGYLAASQSFHESTEVVMLATNLIKKDFQSNNQYDAGIAINCLANVCTPDLARDLATDVVALMNNSKPYVRKKAVLVMYKVFLKFPDSLRPSFGKLKEKLEDPDQAVISSAVNVICELARKNPKNYLSLAPTLFKLLTSNYNNWMLIKIIKLFGALTPLEPRLSKKLVEPLSNLINNTPATSLLYECIQTCTIGMSEQLPLIKLCITKLRSFVEDPDQNLKYLGLLALNNIMKIHPKAVAEHRDLILTCLDDEDVTIRMRALDLLTGMVSKRNLIDIVRKLLEHIEKAEGAYRDDLVDKIVLLCSQNTYAHITDFEWYLTVLSQLTRVHGNPHGSLIASQILDVLVRVEVVRPFGVKQMVSLLRDAHLYSNPTPGGICEVLYAAAWTVGEFSRNLGSISPVDVLGALLQPQASTLPPHIQSVFMQNALKIFAFVVAAAHNVLPATENEEEEQEDFEDITAETIDQANTLLTQALTVFTQSVHLEVQERACFALEILKLYGTLRVSSSSEEVAAELAALFDGTLNPVAKGAQRKVVIPEGLDLDSQINAQDEEDENPFEEEEDDDIKSRGQYDSEEEQGSGAASTGYGSEDYGAPKRGKDSSTPADIARSREQRIQRNAANPYHLGSRGAPRRATLEESPAPVPLPSDLGLGSLVVGSSSKDAPKKKRSHKVYTVKRDEDAPEGASDNEEPAVDTKKNTDALSSINLDEPLGIDEVLPVARHRTDIEKEKKAAAAAAAAKDKSRSGRDGKERPGRDERGRDERGRERDPERRRRREGREGERRGEKEERPRRPRPAQAEGQLIDLGLDAPAAVPSPIGAAAKLIESDYQMLGSPPTQALDVTEKHKEGRERGPREHRERGERRGERRPAGERERRERGSGERREGERREHRGERRERRGEGERRERPAPAAAVGSPATSRRLKYRSLFDSPDLSIGFDTVPGDERGKLQIVFLVENKDDTEITDLKITLTDSLTLRVAKIEGAANAVVEQVSAGQRAKAEAAAIATSVQPQKLKGSVSYTHLGSEKKEDIILALPVSSFIVATPLAKEQFAAILTGDTTPPLVLSSTRVKSTADFKQVVATITSNIHAEPVQVGAENASAYGKSVQGHHIALRLKAGAGGEVAVDIKASDSAIGNALIQEITVLFR